MDLNDWGLDDLKNECGIHGLEAEGEKMEIIRRLRQYFASQASNVGNNNNTTMNQVPSVNATVNAEIRDYNTEENQSVISNIEFNERHNVGIGLSLRDIQDSIDEFSGDDGKSVISWLRNFGEHCEILDMTMLQKFVFAKKMLRGSAKSFINCEARPRNYIDLVRALKKEFGASTNSALVHQQLAKRKKKPNETYRQYIYAMLDIASQANVETEAVITYIVDGLEGHPRHKANLYEARSIDSLKEKLRVYELIQSKIPQDKNKHSNSDKKDENKNEKKSSSEKSSEKVNRCYNCGDKKHSFFECPNKEKGPKCFKCNNYGHKSRDCSEPVKSGQSKVNILNSNKMYKDVYLNDAKLNALIDTGSEITVIREDIFREKKLGKFDKTDKVICGIGSTLKAIGVFKCKIRIDECEFEVNCHVISEKNVPELIVGMNLLNAANVSINSTGVYVKYSGEQKSNVIESETVENKTEMDQAIHEMLNCFHISEFERGMSDLSHILDKSVKDEIVNIIQRYEPKPIKPSPVEMKIILSDESPVYQRPRRLPPIEKAEVENQVQQWIKDGIVKPSSSDYASPIVLVNKKDGSKRVCVDFRQLNKKVYRDRYPLPNIEEQIDMLQSGKFFTTLDLTNGFFHVSVDKQCTKYLAFVTPNGQYEFLKVPFGFCNSPAVFQRFINMIFRDLIAKGYVLIYMDDIIIIAKTIKEAIERLLMVLKIAAEFNLNIKWKKCQFLQAKIEFLGYEVEDGHVRSSPLKTRDVHKFPEPKTTQQIHSFLGLAGYFRKFIKDFALIAKPLSDLLRKDQKFQFSELQRASFTQLKTLICERPVLSIFRYGAETELHTDASKWALGAILMQRDFDDGKMHPIRYLSIKTTETEEIWQSYELEVLAIIKAVRKFRVYLLGHPFTVVTDCKAFQTTMQSTTSPKVARWAIDLQEFDCKFVHRPGSQMQHVDALSRIHLIRQESVQKNFKIAQESDDHIKAIIEVLKQKPYNDFVMHNGLLCKFIDGEYIIVVPENMQYELIRRIHEQGHFKTKKMEEVIKREYFIPKLQDKITDCVRNCVTCILAERKSGKQEGLLHPIPKESFPLDTLHLDHLGPMPSTNKNYNYILTIIDAFSKFVWIFPTKTVTAQESVNKVKTLTAVFGNPKRIICDHGTSFTAEVFKEHCSSENIELVFTTVGVPRGNGQVERIHRIIISVLAKLSIDNPEKWYSHVEKVQQYLNKTYQRSIDTSPFELMIGVQMNTKDDVKIAELIDKEIIDEFKADRDELRVKAKQQIQQIQEENCQTYNAKRKQATQYKVGELVAIKRTQFGTGMKLRPKFFGPYEITKVKGNDRYDVRKVGSHGGPGLTSTSADNMKAWPTVAFFQYDSSGADENVEWPNVEC